MCFPVAGTLMVEPTESEDLAEIDRFCDAMIAIRGEIDRVAAGEWTPEDSPLRGAPHTARGAGRRVGPRLLPRGRRSFPTGFDPDKYWPPVARIDQAYGDRTWSAPARRRRRSPSDAAATRERAASTAPDRTAARRAAGARAGRAAGCPRSSAGVVRDGELVWTGAVRRGDAARRPAAGRAVPDRLDHQDDDRRAGPAAARRGRARPRRPARRAPARRVGYGDRTLARPAVARLRHAAPSRPARGGSAAPAAASSELAAAHRRLGARRSPAGATVPLHQPRPSRCSARSSPGTAAQPWWEAVQRAGPASRSA